MTQQRRTYQGNSDETERLLQMFDHLVREVTARPEQLAADYSLPVEAAPLALGLATIALSGMRAALVEWAPRPPARCE